MFTDFRGKQERMGVSAEKELFMSPKVSRRMFLKAGTAAVGSLAAPWPFSSALAQAIPAPAADYDQVHGYCPFCQTRCTFLVYRKNGRAAFLVGKEGNRWTGGGMCPKGMSFLELVNSPHRLTRPMLKTASGWKNISYEEAVGLTVEKLRAARQKHGEEIAKHLALTAPLWDCRESELAALMTMRFAGCINIMPPGEVCISTASSTLNTLLGTGNSTTTVDEVEKAELLVLWGANISETYPPYTRWLEKARASGARIILLDCRKTRTSNFVDMQIRNKPGTDGTLALGFLNRIIQSGAYDEQYIEKNTHNFASLVKDVSPWTLERVAEATELAGEEILGFYRELEKSRRTIIWLGGSLSRYSNGMSTIRAIIAIQVLRNNIMGSGMGLMTMESGKPEGEKEFVDHICGPAPAGVNFRRLRIAMDRNELDVFFLNSSYRRYPDCDGVKASLRKVGFVIYRGFFKTEELDVAHLFLPATFTLESEGSHYGAEKQVVWRDKCQDAPGDCVPDWQFYRDVGRQLEPEKYPRFENPRELAALFSDTIPDWKGITVDRLRESPGGLVGPIPEIDGPEQLGCVFRDGKFRTADGKFDFLLRAVGPIVWTPPKGSPEDKESDAKTYPLTFIQGKILTQWQQTMTNFAGSLAQFSNGRYVQVHPETAARCGVRHGEMAYLATAFGKIPARVEATEDITPGVVFTPSHFLGSSPYPATTSAPVNSILPNYWDRISAQFNGLGCTLTPMEG
jgi:formate dehydrogenase major subunit